MKYSLFLLLCTLVTTSLNAQTDSLKQFSWATLTTTGPVSERHECNMVEFQDKFYLIGGRGNQPVNVFDPKTNSWSERAKPPIQMHHFQAVAWNDTVYIVGAMTGGYPKEQPLSHVWKYYPKSDTWEQGHLIPEDRRRGGAGAVVYQDNIYLVCGIELGHTSGTNNNFDQYDPLTGEWTVLTRAPHIRDHFSAIVADGKLFCIGGRNTSFHYPQNFGAFFGQTVPFVDVYDFEKGQWMTLKEELPVPSAAGGLVQIGNHLIYAGGESNQPKAHNDTHALDLSTLKWKKLAPLQTGRHGGGAVVWQDKIYIAAGSPKRGGGNMSSIEVFKAN